MRTRGEMLKKDGRRLSNVVVLDTTKRLKAACRKYRVPGTNAVAHPPSLREFVDMVIDSGEDRQLAEYAAHWLAAKDGGR